MVQESSSISKTENQTTEQEIQSVGGWPLTHDKLFREVFQWIELAKAFLRFVLPVPILSRLDIDGLTIEPKDFLSVVFRETRADMIYRVPLLGREESLCVYILLEHKSFNDFFTIFQADQYAGQINQQELRRAADDKRLTVDFRLSPVLVIIFHHDEIAFTGPVDVAGVYEDYDFLADYIPRRRAILFDLSTLPESEIPDDPEVPELFVVLRIMQVIFSTDIGTKCRVVLERLKPYSEIPKYRRLIRFVWFYLVSSARHMSRHELTTITELVKQVIGEKNMPTILEQFRAEGKAEGEAIGEARGKVLTILETRFSKVPQNIERTVREMMDPVALESLVEHAKACQSLNEFAESLK